MKLENYKIVFATVGLIGVLLLASPAIAALISFPSGEAFSELYVLGPEHMAENYPHNVEVGPTYSVFLGVGNHLDSAAYYVLYVKLQSLTDPLPNSTSGTPSPTLPLYEYRFSITDGETWEGPLTFSVSNATISGNQSIVQALKINDLLFNVDKSAGLDSNSTEFSYLIVFELWLYDVSSNSVQYHNRFVDLKLNLAEAPQISG